MSLVTVDNAATTCTVYQNRSDSSVVEDKPCPQRSHCVFNPHATSVDQMAGICCRPSDTDARGELGRMDTPVQRRMPIVVGEGDEAAALEGKTMMRKTAPSADNANNNSRKQQQVVG